MTRQELTPVALTTRDEPVVCPVCRKTWRIYPAAHVPTAMLSTGAWVHLTVEPDDGGPVLAYSWQCGDHRITATLPAWDTVPCMAGGIPWRWSGPTDERHLGRPVVCLKRQTQTTPPPDLYTNPRYGSACECCGQQGTHRVRRDGQGPIPTCGQAYGLQVLQMAQAHGL